MHTAIGKVLPLAMLVAMIIPAHVTPSVEILDGKNVTWNIDCNLDRIIDGKLIVENISIVNDPVESLEDMTCSIAYMNVSLGTTMSIPGTTLEWMNVSLVAFDLDDPGEIFVDTFAEVNREFIPVNVTFENDTWMIGYDKQTGLLLAIYQEYWSNEIQRNRDFYLRLESTDVFFNAVSITPYMIWIAGGTFVVIVIYTSLVTVRDQKIRKKRACFGEGCW